MDGREGGGPEPRRSRLALFTDRERRGMLNGRRRTWASRMAADGMAEAEAQTRRDGPMVVEADGQGPEVSRGVGVAVWITQRRTTPTYRRIQLAFSLGQWRCGVKGNETRVISLRTPL